MAGDLVSYRRPGGRGAKAPAQAKESRWYVSLVPLCILFVFASGMIFVQVRQVASTKLELQKTEPDIVLMHEVQETRSEAVVTPESQNAGMDEAQKTGPELVETPETPGRNANIPALPQLVLGADVANKVGHKIWLNETGVIRDAITSWNANEEFASLGIGHFVWFPIGKAAPFEESFPQLLEFLRTQNVRLPPWLDTTPVPPCPWISRVEFTKNFNSPEMTQLRQFLLDTMAEQTQFLVMRAQRALDKILDSTPEGFERGHIINQFSRIVQASKDLYPLIDYVNFKGEGTNSAETSVDKQTGARQGWGLKQVLLRMTGTTSEPTAVLAEFADAAQFVLQQRIRNIPANRIWQAGWSRRVETYRRPVNTTPEVNHKKTRNEPLRKRG
jgi:hypothetical protein